ncbi:MULTISPECIES: hypothetical protein [Moorena]|uniref:hypothetical protein n=1 Tax=Moorena TaxID=1155738 RepID=UPI0003073D7E|nr:MULTISPECIES: hypothetical protein [Moorena]NEQ16220.1 hypothetical protein [Moorena sp. SIO3E2]NEP31522.1 hypothetical protein [Moorena sp. SIO3B2]NEP64263.1 hypothetical protein [Moorena sp. SIO3A5]NER88372.1 hypothetical protein [Moorena sp. SIO3A2]NES40069.1 hypothetical protein [Moorena sp. SIO2C4]
MGINPNVHAVSVQLSAVAQALALAFWPFGHATRTATLCERCCGLTQIKAMLTCFIQKHLK